MHTIKDERVKEKGFEENSRVAVGDRLVSGASQPLSGVINTPVPLTARLFSTIDIILDF